MGVRSSVSLFEYCLDTLDGLGWSTFVDYFMLYEYVTLKAPYTDVRPPPRVCFQGFRHVHDAAYLFMLDVVNKEGKALSGAGFTRGVRLNHTMRLRLANSESSANDLQFVLKEMNSIIFQCQLSLELEQKAANSPHVRTLTGSIPGTGFGVVFNRCMVDAIRGARESA